MYIGVAEWIEHTILYRGVNFKVLEQTVRWRERNYENMFKELPQCEYKYCSGQNFFFKIATDFDALRLTLDSLLKCFSEFAGQYASEYLVTGQEDILICDAISEIIHKVGKIDFLISIISTVQVKMSIFLKNCSKSLIVLRIVAF